MNNDTRAYLLEFNGEGTASMLPLKPAKRRWDYITLQQVAASAFRDTYCPYAGTDKYIGIIHLKQKIAASDLGL